MKVSISEIVNARVLEVAEYVLETTDNIRSTAKVFGVGKSTIHKDLNERLRVLNPELYSQIHNILVKNKYLGQHKGGEATSKRYKRWKNLN